VDPHAAFQTPVSTNAKRSTVIVSARHRHARPTKLPIPAILHAEMIKLVAFRQGRKPSVAV
jgi:hypothetical protein